VFTAGTGGKITVNTPVLTVQDGGSIESGSGSGETELSSCGSETQSCGWAGDIEVHTDYLTLQQGQLTTEAFHSGGGNITLDVRQRFYSRHSILSAKAWGKRSEDHGGDLTIAQPTFFILGEQTTLNANANQGHGGYINVVASEYIKSADEVTITATSVANLPGKISIAATPEDFIGLLSFSPKRYSTTTKVVRHSCGRRGPKGKKEKKENTFQAILQEMLHPAPSDLRFFSPEM
jgi:large exoprotein involved in heme utilization and adhesion